MRREDLVVIVLDSCEPFYGVVKHKLTNLLAGQKNVQIGQSVSRVSFGHTRVKEKPLLAPLLLCSGRETSFKSDLTPRMQLAIEDLAGEALLQRMIMILIGIEW